MPPLPLFFDIASVGRTYRLVPESSSFRVTCATTTAGTVSLVHSRHSTFTDAIADLLLTMITDGDAIVEPLCAKAAATQAGWKYGRPGFPVGSGILKRWAEETKAAFEQLVMEHGRAVQTTLDDAETRGIELPAWKPIPAWLEVALEEVEEERLVAVGFG